MDDDFNTSEALAVLFEIAKDINKLRDTDVSAAQHAAALLKHLASILGLLQQPAENFLKAGVGTEELDDEAIEQLIAKRNEARANKDWAESDRIRDELKEQGIILEDGAQGVSWRRA
jgi:cysteinyl-tRNA synthetase